MGIKEKEMKHKGHPMLSLGLMSGTSMDGIDAALIRTNGDYQIELLAQHTLVYDTIFQKALKVAETVVRQSRGDLKQASNCFKCEGWTLEGVILQSTALHAIAVKELFVNNGYSAQQIDVVGYHGQTLFHKPAMGLSVIVGDGQFLANDLGIPVVNDFRSQDIALGGQGAPFAPLYHQALAVRDQTMPVVVVNCGGIANVSIILNANPNDLIAFDTGPGNALIDRLVRLRTQGQESMDRNGHYGLQGKIHNDILKALYAESLVQNAQSYFFQDPPKSLDSGDLQLIPALEVLSLEDACRTLETFTADTIVSSVAQCMQKLGKTMPEHWVVAGGGFKNPVITMALKNALHSTIGSSFKLNNADEIGWHSQSLEAQMFGYYAVRCLQQKPISFPGTTGVAKPTCGGVCYKPAYDLFVR